MLVLLFGRAVGTNRNRRWRCAGLRLPLIVDTDLAGSWVRRGGCSLWVLKEATHPGTPAGGCQIVHQVGETNCALGEELCAAEGRFGK